MCERQDRFNGFEWWYNVEALKGSSQWKFTKISYRFDTNDNAEVIDNNTWNKIQFATFMFLL